MPTANVLLQLWKGGWRVQRAPVITDNLRIEAALGTGSLDSPEEAERVAIGQLNLYAEPIVARTVAVEPVGPADTPWLSHIPGQTVTDGDQQLVESLSFRRDKDGHLAYYAELNSHIDTPEERFELALKKMANGTLGGTSRVAQPVNLTQPAQLYRAPGTGGGTGKPFIVFDRNADTTVDESKPWTANFDGIITTITANIPTADVCYLELWVNGSYAADLSSPGGLTQDRVDGLTVAVVVDDVLSIYAPDIGFDLVVTCWT